MIQTLKCAGKSALITSERRPVVCVHNLRKKAQLLDIKAALTKNRLRKNEIFGLMAPIGRLLIDVCTA